MKNGFKKIKDDEELVIDDEKKSKIKKNKKDSEEIKKEESTGEVVINVIEDEPYEDLSAFYNVEDIGILDSSEDELSKKGKGKKKILALISAVLVLVIGIGAYSMFVREKTVYYSLYEKGDVYNNGVLEVTFEELNVLDSLLTYELDPDYVYIALVYDFKNVSNAPLDWSATPYMSLKPYVYLENKDCYLPMEEDSEEANTLLSLLSQSVINEISSDNTSDIIADTIEPNQGEATADNGSISTEGSADNSSVGGSEEGTDTNENQIVTIENNALYGNFDFGVLQIFALDYGIDFSTAKDDLAPGESRQSADIFKIRKELFDNNVYFIGADNLDAIFKVDLTPVDTTIIHNMDDTQDGNTDLQ